MIIWIIFCCCCAFAKTYALTEDKTPELVIRVRRLCCFGFKWWTVVQEKLMIFLFDIKNICKSQGYQLTFTSFLAVTKTHSSLRYMKSFFFFTLEVKITAVLKPFPTEWSFFSVLHRNVCRQSLGSFLVCFSSRMNGVDTFFPSSSGFRPWTWKEKKSDRFKQEVMLHYWEKSEKNKHYVQTASKYILTSVLFGSTSLSAAIKHYAFFSPLQSKTPAVKSQTELQHI